MLAAAVMAQLLFVLLAVLEGDPTFGADSPFALAMGVIGGGVVYIAICLILRHDEAAALFERLDQRLFGARG